MRAKSTRLLLFVWLIVVAAVGGYLACGDDTVITKDDGGADGPVITDGVVTPDGPVVDAPADALLDAPVDGLLDAPGDALLDGIATDAPILPDGLMPFNCGEIMDAFKTCAKGCAGNTTCILGCHTTYSPLGCASGQTAWGALFGCLAQNCLADCQNDPDAAACTSCITNSCGTEETACLADVCPQD